MSWPIHEAAELFPMFDPMALEALAADIREYGLTMPVTIWRNADGADMLLDGRNRVRACELACVPVRAERYEGAEPWRYAISLNLMRRQLTPSQATAAALKARPALMAEAAIRRTAYLQRGVEQDQSPLAPIGANGDDQQKHVSKSAQEAAELFGVSGRNVERMARVERERPDLVERVAGGEVSVNAAYEAVKTGGEPLALGAGRRNDKRKPFPLDRFVSEMLGAIGAVNDWIKTEDLSSFSAEQIGRWAADLRRARPAITKMIRHLEGNLTNEECDSDDQSE